MSETNLFVRFAKDILEKKNSENSETNWFVRFTVEISEKKKIRNVRKQLVCEICGKHFGKEKNPKYQKPIGL